MKVLVIRRDNIGDLVLTIPLLRTLIDSGVIESVSLLVNDYNRPVADYIPGIARIFSYAKAKHQSGLWGKLSAWLSSWRLVTAIRKERFDVAILAGGSYSRQAEKFARLAGIPRVIGYAPSKGESCWLTDIVSRQPDDIHHAEVTHRLVSPLNISAKPGSSSVKLPEVLLAEYRQKVARQPDEVVVGLQLSARKPSQQWSAEHFHALAVLLAGTLRVRFVLFWSPGPEDHPAHPGDDEKAARVQVMLNPLAPVVACHTDSLDALMAGLSQCDVVLSADGGAMHLAAAVTRPVVALFGHTDAGHWHPWGVPYRLLQPASRHVRDIAPANVADAILEVLSDEGLINS